MSGRDPEIKKRWPRLVFLRHCTKVTYSIMTGLCHTSTHTISINYVLCLPTTTSQTKHSELSVFSSLQLKLHTLAGSRLLNLPSVCFLRMRRLDGTRGGWSEYAAARRSLAERTLVARELNVTISGAVPLSRSAGRCCGARVNRGRSVVLVIRTY